MSDILARGLAANAKRSLYSVGLPVGAAIGDSITAPDSNVGDQVTPNVTLNYLKTANGYMAWALALSGQRVRLPINHIWSFPGQETGTILSNLPAFFAQMTTKPGFVVIECGTNNILHGTATATVAAITADWTAIATYLANQGIRTIFLPIMPRINTAFTTAAMYETQDRCNRWLSRFALQTQGWVAVASACLTKITDPASVGASYRTGVQYSYDGTHFGTTSGYEVGKAISAILNVWYPPIDLLPTNNLTYASGLTRVNLLTNPMMQGAGGTVSAGTNSSTNSGTAPTGWTVALNGLSGLTNTNSQVTSALTGRPMHQMVFGGTYTVSGVSVPNYAVYARLQQSVATGALGVLSTGDVIEGLIEFEIDAANVSIVQPSLEMRWKNSSSFNTDLYKFIATGVSGEQLMPTEAVSGVMRTASHTFDGTEFPLTGGDVYLMAYAYLKNCTGTYSPSATIRFGRAVIQKVET